MVPWPRRVHRFMLCPVVSQFETRRLRQAVCGDGKGEDTMQTSGRFSAVVAFVAFMAAYGPHEGQTSTEMCDPVSRTDRKDCAELWNACRPVAFQVVLIAEPTSVPTLSLTQEDIEITVRSRLRGARIFADKPDLRVLPTMDADGYLHVHVHIGGDLVMWSVDFQKVREDLATDLIGFSSTGWAQRAYGGYDNDPNTVLSSIAPAIDKFVDDYLRVNAPACDAERAPRYYLGPIVEDPVLAE